MTIEDLIHVRDERIERLNRFLRLAHLGLRGKENAVARKARRRLIGEIGFMLDYEREALDADLEYLYSTTPAQRALDERAEPGCWGNEDHFATDFAVVPLLDAAPLAGDDGRMLNPANGHWYHVEDGYPKKVPATAEELGDFAALIDRMQQELNVTFTVDRFFWTESTLEIWVLSHEMREQRTGGRSG
ncbi:hypothetical protein [Brucella intermedia]|uniref:Uncharacterized protein n=1 Tax=Brucella intermedia M86 TaxID=1234597 RepID=M5JSW2_9HYPH|nr:hypothetical protein [Brucella intermedia]ELT51208.1 hypothetical protein D584_00125 [Brucella intermedia M86]